MPESWKEFKAFDTLQIPVQSLEYTLKSNSSESSSFAANSERGVFLLVYAIM